MLLKCHNPEACRGKTLQGCSMLFFLPLLPCREVNPNQAINGCHDDDLIPQTFVCHYSVCSSPPEMGLTCSLLSTALGTNGNPNNCLGFTSKVLLFSCKHWRSRDGCFRAPQSKQKLPQPHVHCQGQHSSWVFPGKCVQTAPRKSTQEASAFVVADTTYTHLQEEILRPGKMP